MLLFAGPWNTKATAEATPNEVRRVAAHAIQLGIGSAAAAVENRRNVLHLGDRLTGHCVNVAVCGVLVLDSATHIMHLSASHEAN